MQIIRTAIWVLLLVALLLFSIANWDPTVTVRIWEGIVVDTKTPAIVIVSFLIGFAPMWLYHRGSKWKTNRRIASLEHALRTATTPPISASHDGVEDGRVADAPDSPLNPAGGGSPSTDSSATDPDTGPQRA
jgi:hypothetical protein